MTAAHRVCARRRRGAPPGAEVIAAAPSLPPPMPPELLLLWLRLRSRPPRENSESAPRIGQSTTAETASARTGANDDGAFSAFATLWSSKLSCLSPFAAGTQSMISEIEQRREGAARPRGPRRRGFWILAPRRPRRRRRRPWPWPWLPRRRGRPSRVGGGRGGRGGVGLFF